MSTIIELDQRLFALINGKWHSDFSDVVFPILRTSQLSVVLYVFLFVFVLLNFKQNAWWWIVFTALTAVLTDFISSDIIKQNLFRLRPINDPDLFPPARELLGYRPQSSSFTSSHAVNHFGLAAFFFFTLKPFIHKWAWLFFLWSFSIIYAQVYVGVHYPLDVLAGGAIGFLFGYLSARSFNKHYGLTLNT